MYNSFRIYPCDQLNSDFIWIMTDDNAQSQEGEDLLHKRGSLKRGGQNPNQVPESLEQREWWRDLIITVVRRWSWHEWGLWLSTDRDVNCYGLTPRERVWGLLFFYLFAQMWRKRKGEG